ncbi:mannose-1-phosphate guanylyltransferase/mannose-6-phosphate isomerase [Marinobacter sp. JSM 1782161]|uniref:mannose-1-phosphate guanylyltransferase/mannose-6-phosphate isomerase n=1 Tax=Marinobacter sp. JSM 1782161 TaxID=2685906 RepID=UPI001403F614|nr:mannose-1-phosphate guanylyltransferase/mannose-6-phosphate isomerase [Marinobacter sp. JSM 1782161]
MIPVILSGGTGSRLWPLSREAFPKQFLQLAGEESLLQQTLSRLPEDRVSDPLIVASNQHRFILSEQLEAIGCQPRSILLEPFARNTAPAVAMAALAIADENPEALMLVLPADHNVRDEAAFRAALAQGESAAATGSLVLFGVLPSGPETDYGYIGAEPAPDLDDGLLRANQFLEKPDRATAERMLAKGGHFWNSGILLCRADRYLEELRRHSPDIYDTCRLAAGHVWADLEFSRIPSEIYEHCPEDSVDRAVLEKTDSAVVVPLDAGWRDMGSWSAYWESSEQDEQQNVVVGDALMEDAHGCLVHAGGRLVTMLGVNDLVVVDTRDALLVARRHRVQEVKELVEKMRAEERPQVDAHREVYRPWGSYDSVDAGHRFQVKRISVKPGEQLSLQKHHHRAEHWIVVSGTAEVTRNDETYLLTENESTYIPIGAVHRLANPGKIPLELIEVQSGAYLGEDDIERLQDNYGRTEQAGDETTAPASAERA